MSKSRTKKKKKNKNTGSAPVSDQAQERVPSSGASSGASKADSGKAPKEKGAKKAASTSSSKKAAPKKDDKKKPNIFKRFISYCRDVRTEMQRVTWPTKSDVAHSSLVVIGALIFFGVLIYLVDTAMVPLLLAYSRLG